jgi:hypothetical protein
MAAKNYRIMRHQQRFWAIMDCDEKGRPITMTPVFRDTDLKKVRAKLEELEKPAKKSAKTAKEE